MGIVSRSMTTKTLLGDLISLFLTTKSMNGRTRPIKEFSICRSINDMTQSDWLNKIYDADQGPDSIKLINYNFFLRTKWSLKKIKKNDNG